MRTLRLSHYWWIGLVVVVLFWVWDFGGIFMPNYRRAAVGGGTYFFTVVTYRRQHFLCDDAVRSALRTAIRDVRKTHPFDIDAWVLLPDHLHCIWTLPPGDADFGKRWGLIKRYVSQHCGHLKRDHWLTESKQHRRESTLWQRRFWEHQIRDEWDLCHHFDYIHFNPVKHGHVVRVADWAFSSFHRYREMGVYSLDWAGGEGVSSRVRFGE